MNQWNLSVRSRKGKTLIWILILFASAAEAVEPGRNHKKHIVATIAPVHSLVQMVLGNTATAELLVDGRSSVHEFQLKPSQQRSVQNADLLFMVHPGLEYFLASRAGRNGIISLADSQGIVLREKRSRNTAINKDGEHNHGHSHDFHESGKGLPTLDLHIWLDPENAIAMVRRIERVLSRAYPQDAAVFRSNSSAAEKALNELGIGLAQIMAPVSDLPFIVFHDAYGYFEARYDLNGAGAILLNPEVPPSVKQINSIREQIRQSGALCVFSEPQFSDKLVKTVTEDLNLRTAMLDPLGSEETPGSGHYIATLNGLASDISSCLSTQ